MTYFAKTFIVTVVSIGMCVPLAIACDNLDISIANGMWVGCGWAILSLLAHQVWTKDCQ